MSVANALRNFKKVRPLYQVDGSELLLAANNRRCLMQGRCSSLLVAPNNQGLLLGKPPHEHNRYSAETSQSGNNSRSKARDV